MIAALVIFAFLYFLFFARFDLMAGDEGYFNIVSYRMIEGEVPYRDFFLHTPPVSYLLETGVFSVFGQDFIVGRVTTAITGVLITILLFLVASRVSDVPFSLVPGLVFIFWGTSHIPYPSFNWHGLLVALGVMLALFKFTDSGKRKFLVAVGILVGLLCLIKQNLGAAAIISVAIYLWLYRPKKIDVFIDYAFTGIGGVLAGFPIILYFYKNGALQSMLFYLFNFSSDTLKLRMELFPFPHLKPMTFFLLGLYLLLGYALVRASFRKKYVLFFATISTIVLGTAFFYGFATKNAVLYANDHIKEGIINGFFNLPAFCIIMILFLLLSKAIKKVATSQRDLYLRFAVIFSIFYIWFGLIKSRDLLHLIPTMPIAYLFFGYLLAFAYNAYKAKLGQSMMLKTYYFIVPVIFFCLFGLYTNMNNETFKFSSTPLTEMNYSPAIERAKHLIVEKKKGKDMEELVKYIDSHTRPNEKIFLFHIDSSFYILADRSPATFHTFFIPDAFRSEDQERVIRELDGNKVRLVVCKKRIYDRWEAVGDAKKDWPTARIEKFLRTNFYVKKIMGLNYILMRK